LLEGQRVYPGNLLSVFVNDDEDPIQPIFGIWMGASPYPAVYGAVAAAEA
jgi:hypothetical protein